jgi:hypothetical protein
MARAQADAARVRPKGLLDKLSSAMAVGPDTSATLRGPVELGGVKAGGVENAGATTSSPASATLVAQPIGDAALNAGQPVDAKPDADAPSKATGSNALETPASPSSGGSTPAADPNKVTAAGTPGGTESPEAKPAAKAADADAKSSAGEAGKPASGQGSAVISTKKKGKLHKLKKIVDPF